MIWICWFFSSSWKYPSIVVLTVYFKKNRFSSTLANISDFSLLSLNKPFAIFHSDFLYLRLIFDVSFLTSFVILLFFFPIIFAVIFWPLHFHFQFFCKRFVGWTNFLISWPVNFPRLFSRSKTFFRRACGCYMQCLVFGPCTVRFNGYYMFRQFFILNSDNYILN